MFMGVMKKMFVLHIQPWLESGFLQSKHLIAAIWVIICVPIQKYILMLYSIWAILIFTMYCFLSCGMQWMNKHTLFYTNRIWHQMWQIKILNFEKLLNLETLQYKGRANQQDPQ